jgi:hypothetical protein
MIPAMSNPEANGELPANTLCKSCGLCCTGHLFIWTKLKSVELKPAEKLGLRVFGSAPSQRGFGQPCPLWQGQCTIYASPHYPHYCHTYKCTLLKKLLDETTSLPEALLNIEEAKRVIRELEALLPESPYTNFRERLVAHLDYLEQKSAWEDGDLKFRLKADALLVLYEQVFGVNDLI